MLQSVQQSCVENFGVISSISLSPVFSSSSPKYPVPAPSMSDAPALVQSQNLKARIKVADASATSLNWF